MAFPPALCCLHAIACICLAGTGKTPSAKRRGCGVFTAGKTSTRTFLRDRSDSRSFRESRTKETLSHNDSRNGNDLDVLEFASERDDRIGTIQLRHQNIDDDQICRLLTVQP
jgi:hypothetical protein